MMRTALLAFVLGAMSCDKTQVVTEGASKVDDSAEQAIEELPEALEGVVTRIVDATPEDRKAEIRAAEFAELTVDHLGVGMALRNGELRIGGSEVVRAFARRGIFHSDDLSSIILVSAARRIRGEGVDLPGQIKVYRDYWAEYDMVAPTDLACPACSSEMQVGGLGSGISEESPERYYFFGDCPNGHRYLYYHADGWLEEDSVWGGPFAQEAQVQEPSAAEQLEE